MSFDISFAITSLMPSDPPRLYLITPPLADLSGFMPMFAAALAAGDLACVLLRLAVRDETEAKRIVRGLREAASSRDVALLVEGDAKLAARSGADGVHIRGGGGALQEALDSLKPERIVGCGGLELRHDAMLAGEAGVDYVMFGDPDTSGRKPSFSDTLARTAWWADIFTVPCVACASRLEELGDLAEAGADFVALHETVWRDPRGVAAALDEVRAALAEGAGAAG